MKKVSTVAAKPGKKISQQKLTVGLDLGDRNSWYCVLDESGQIQLEQRVRTNAKALREVFGAMPRGRIALGMGTHSPWISRLLSQLGHEVIVANAACFPLHPTGLLRTDRERSCNLTGADPGLRFGNSQNHQPCNDHRRHHKPQPQRERRSGAGVHVAEEVRPGKSRYAADRVD
jgi:hypothetical protein